VNKYCNLEIEDYLNDTFHGEKLYYCNECKEEAYFDEDKHEC